MKRIVKKIIQRILYPLLVFVRLDQFLARQSNHRRLIVFFHGVRQAKSPQINGRHMPVGEFETLMQLLKSRFDIVPLEQICEKEDNTGRKKIAITFDDGFLNNLVIAQPVLKRLETPATFFICTRCLADPNYVHPSDLIDLLKLSGQDIEIAGEKFRIRNNHYVAISNGRSAYDFLASLSPSQLTRSLDDLAGKHNLELLKAKTNPEVFKLLSAGDIDQLRSDPLASLGSHSHQHVHMITLNSVELNEELVRSRTALEKHDVKCLAFPYGDFNEEAISIARRVGFRFLFAGGHVEPPFADAVFPRIGVSNTAGPAFNLLSISRGFQRFGF